MTIDPTELARLKEKAERFQWIDMPAPVDGSDLLALIAEVERLQSQLAQVSEVACERRLQLQTQTDLRVAAEERAGRKNVARLEAEVERLQAERDSLIGKLGDERSAHGRTQGSLALTEMDVEELRARLHQHEASPIQVIAMGRKGT